MGCKKAIVFTSLTFMLFLQLFFCFMSTKYVKSSDDLNQNAMLHISVVVCGADDRAEETLVNIKSAVLFSRRTIKFHIFVEENLQAKIRNSLESWPDHIQSNFKYNIYPITYPKDGYEKSWKKLFKLCASQRLFLPHLLNDVDLLLYVDTDILFLSPVEEIWTFFESFNSSHISAMAPEHEDTSVSWYHRFARHPYYGKFGINSGIMLMNMSRIRKVKLLNDLQPEVMTWDDILLPLYQKYKYNITWGDQDLLNIIFSHNSDKLLLFSCKWNYRPDHCMYMQVCPSVREHGAKMLHGCRRAFHIEKWPEFKAVYSAIKNFNFNDDKSVLLTMIDENLAQIAEPSNCGKYFNVVLSGLRANLLAKQEL